MISNDILTIVQHRDELLDGLGMTVMLALGAGFGALVLGCALTVVLMTQPRGLALPARGFIELMRCTPFLLLVYLVYYGLPAAGVRLDNIQAGLFSLILYHTAYVAEILRASWLAQPREEVEAARAFGYRGLRMIRRLILPNVLLASVPMLGNQAIQIVKDSSFLTIIAVAELTFAANNIQSNYYIPFAALLSAVLLYWLICAVIELAVARLRRVAERYQ